MGLVQSLMSNNTTAATTAAVPAPLVIDTTVKDETSLLTKPKNLSPITEEVTEPFKEPTVEDKPHVLDTTVPVADVKATIITTPNITSIIEPEMEPETDSTVTDSTVTSVMDSSVTTTTSVTPVEDSTSVAASGSKVEVTPVDVSPAADVVKKNKKKNKNKGNKH